MSAAALVTVYQVLIRPCVDYACVVYHPMLTSYQSEQLERQRRKILKIIYGWDVTYESALSKAGLDRLNYRRQELVERFVLKLEANKRFASWIPLNDPARYELRETLKYRELPFRTERLR